MSERGPAVRPVHAPPEGVVAALRCSVCSAALTLTGRALRCDNGHTFDLARQGYVNLLHAAVDQGTADTAAMVTAREEFLSGDHYAPLADALATRARGAFVVDAGAGTGHYLARVLDALPHALGLALDVSAPAARRAARAHPRLGAAVWNLWQPWPVGSGVADLVLNVFAPRNPAEFHRVLAPGGRLLVAGPGAGHLRELATSLPLLDIGDDKSERLDDALGEHFDLVERVEVGGPVTLRPEDLRRVVRMGPNAHHLHRDALGERLAALSEPTDVTTAFTVSVYERRG
ncbi:rRNA (guanine-N1)-methyltransferase [Saccharomonospora piscinae]|uniref:rRNA (Guanine-N1)-methyltransferase n=1 Tax=Saccharomonospora piscinae TaxID=687388 RepID=A0A1V8ZZ49_SACPI|nr:rRNA (guanine-N1)-methyltransferase [Saccharomonospora piscinae]OQO90078.1 rRNA (guanine-N1)-methyltransferase [Saccharomonospora piscinae]TLW90908.1 rRNA (guanine-N1)-methyltransferase [Saccharomonospora piscinae]